MKGLLTQLRLLSKNMRTSLRNPNRGGCCVIAAEVASYLDQLVPVRIRVSNDHFDWEGWKDKNCNLNQACEEMGDNAGHHQEWNNRDVFFGHVIVEFDYRGRTYHMDTSGCKEATDRDPSFHWLMYDGYLPLNAARELAARPGNWNQRFDRSQIPVIRGMVKQAFAPLNITPKAV